MRREQAAGRGTENEFSIPIRDYETLPAPCPSARSGFSIPIRDYEIEVKQREAQQAEVFYPYKGL